MISVVAKVFERIVYDQLYAYLEEHSIICKYRSGFRATNSTVTALLEATDTWAYNIDRGKTNAVVFLDLKKGLTVEHEILLFRLSHLAYVEIRLNGLRAIMVYKSLHGLAPDYLFSKFERRETAYNLRD